MRRIVVTAALANSACATTEYLDPPKYSDIYEIGLAAGKTDVTVVTRDQQSDEILNTTTPSPFDGAGITFARLWQREQHRCQTVSPIFKGEPFDCNVRMAWGVEGGAHHLRSIDSRTAVNSYTASGIFRASTFWIIDLELGLTAGSARYYHSRRGREESGESGEQPGIDTEDDAMFVLGGQVGLGFTLGEDKRSRWRLEIGAKTESHDPGSKSNASSYSFDSFFSSISYGWGS